MEFRGISDLEIKLAAPVLGRLVQSCYYSLNIIMPTHTDTLICRSESLSCIHRFMVTCCEWAGCTFSRYHLQVIHDQKLRWLNLWSIFLSSCSQYDLVRAQKCRDESGSAWGTKERKTRTLHTEKWISFVKVLHDRLIITV